MSADKECAGLFGRLFGHKFRYRCDDVLSDAAEGFLDRLEEVESHEVQYIVKAFQESIYVQDVCVRCGAIANRMAGART